jgi:hypothetical protein
MRALDDTPIDPEIAAELDAIDETLAGGPVAPRYAEIAELALLLAGDRPQPRDEFLRSLDARVERRFTSAGTDSRAVGAPSTPRARRWWAAWGFAPVWGSAAVGLAAAVAVVVVLSSGGGSRSPVVDALSLRAPRSGSVASPPAAGSATTSSAGSPTRSSAGSATTASPALGPLKEAAPPAPTPPPNGRRIIQSAQLSLAAPAGRIEAVSQEVFNVAHDEEAVVDHSSVTASGSPGAYAQFQLSIPSGNLAQAMAQLSRLQYARVTSRTDATQDVNNRFVGERRALGDFQALRTSLLKQLAAAVSTEQLASIQARLHDVEAKINGVQLELKRLRHAVGFSQVQVTINAGAAQVASHRSSSHGFTLGGAVHDAGRVLTVAAGVALIAVAALVPLGLVTALVIWIGVAVRRRRREHALDLA